MGLNCTHGFYDGSYGTFTRLRRAIMDASPSLPFVGPPNDDDWSYSIIGDYPERCYFGWWDKDFPYSDPLEILFVHSDCGGYIFPRDAEALADALLKIVVNVQDEPFFSYKDMTLNMINALNACPRCQ